MSSNVLDHVDSPVSRRKILGIVGLGGAAALLAACGQITTPSTTSQTNGGSSPNTTGQNSGTTSPAASSGATEAWLYLTILTGGQDGKKGYPEYVTSMPVVPANTTVHCEIRCFDDGPASIPSGYEKVKGTTDGNITLISGLTGDISTAKTQTVQSVDPKNVAHTFTVAETGLNIPIPPLTTVRFDFQSGAAGKHSWQCMAACGSGASGWEGAMAEDGYMKGTLTVQA